MNAFKILGDKAELLMVGFAIGVLLVLFTPIPASLLDVLLIINFSWALMMLLLTYLFGLWQTNLLSPAILEFEIFN